MDKQTEAIISSLDEKSLFECVPLNWGVKFESKNVNTILME
jgi:hypothetical protein